MNFLSIVDGEYGGQYTSGMQGYNRIHGGMEHGVLVCWKKPHLVPAHGDSDCNVDADVRSRRRIVGKVSHVITLNHVIGFR